MSNPTWTERVEAEFERPFAILPRHIARSMAARLDDPKRQEDEEVGRLMRTLRPDVGIDDNGLSWWAEGGGFCVSNQPDLVAALRALRDAIGGAK